ncbi:hypothetical protein F4677DRAFT_439279 [Hypoxylon crocopeplum]|nr:hypothetical protein F4677DRAFT_439279 [Hypoxylon crocopeplum]
MSSTTGFAEPIPELISVPAFKAVLWLISGLMTVAFSARAYIRFTCFRRLFVEDWLMFASLLIFITISVVGTIYLQDLFNLSHIADGTFVPGPTFEEDTIEALRAFAAISILVYVGIWIIKLNFLVFFYRLGNQLPRFRIFWWIVLVFVVATGIAQMGLIEFKCMLSDIDTLIGYCSTIDNLEDTRRRFIVSVTTDIASDFLMICFPVTLLWASQINLRQKLVLSGIFSLVAFTIAVTIVRGGFSTNINSPSAATELNISVDFWVTLEYLVSFLIACTISFRSLFTQRRNKVSQRSERAARRMEMPTSNRGRDGKGHTTKASKWRRFQDTILDTCKGLEAPDDEYQMFGLPAPASGLMTVDFSRGEEAAEWTSHPKAAYHNSRTMSRASRDDSVKSLRPTQTFSSPV